MARSVFCATLCFHDKFSMDKSNWITILLDGTVQEAKILDFLDMSYDLTDGRIEESIE